MALKIRRQHLVRFRYIFLVIGPSEFADSLVPWAERHRDVLCAEDSAYQGSEAMLMHPPHGIILYDTGDSYEMDRKILSRSGRLHGVPIVLVRGSHCTWSIPTALGKGFDVVVRPETPPDEIYALIRAQAASRRTVHHDFSGKIIADSSLLPLSGLLEMVSREGSSGVIRMHSRSNGVSGTIWLEMGAPIHALYDTIMGDEAVIAMIRQQDCIYDMQVRTVPTNLAANIESTSQNLIMEAMRQNDEGAPDLIMGPMLHEDKPLLVQETIEWIKDDSNLCDISFHDLNDIDVNGDTIIISISEVSAFLSQALSISASPTPDEIAILAEARTMIPVLRIGPDESQRISIINYDPEHVPREIPKGTLGFIIAPASVWSVHAATSTRELVDRHPRALVGTIGPRGSLDRIVSRSDYGAEQSMNDRQFDLRAFLAGLIGSG